MRLILGAVCTVASVAVVVTLLWMDMVKSRKIEACEARNGIPLFYRSGAYRACAAATVTWGE